MLQRGLPRLALVAVGLACCCTGITAVPTTAASDSGGDAATSTLFACGSNGDMGADTKQIIDVFSAANSVCCGDLQEQCDASSSTLPTTCQTAGCARGVDVVAQSCAAAFADGFLGVAFKPQLDPLVAKCRAAEEDPTPTYVISNPDLHHAATTTCHGRVIDGAGSEFHTSVTGQDKIVLQAPQGMQLQVTAEAMHFSPHGNVRVYDGANIDAPQLGLLRGTTLPEQVKDREFVSSKGVLTVMRVVDLQDDAGLPLMFSLTVECICSD